MMYVSLNIVLTTEMKLTKKNRTIFICMLTCILFFTAQMPIKKLYMLIEMAAQGEDGGSAEAIYAGREKIKITHFFDCLQDVVRF